MAAWNLAHRGRSGPDPGLPGLPRPDQRHPVRQDRLPGQRFQRRCPSDLRGRERRHLRHGVQHRHPRRGRPALRRGRGAGSPACRACRSTSTPTATSTRRSWFGRSVAFPNGTGDVDWNGDGVVRRRRRRDRRHQRRRRGDPGRRRQLPARLGPANGPASPTRLPEDRRPTTATATVFDLGDALAVTWTDSWDDNTPTNCQGAEQPGRHRHRGRPLLRRHAQLEPGAPRRLRRRLRLQRVRPGASARGQPEARSRRSRASTTTSNSSRLAPAVAATLQLGLLPAADYIVEAATPPGFQTLREHHQNVSFGDEFMPASGGPAAGVRRSRADGAAVLRALATMDGAAAT